MINKIKVFRAINDLTQAELAAKVKVTTWTVSQMELNHYSPSVKLALRIAKMLNCKVEDLFIPDEDGN